MMRVIALSAGLGVSCASPVLPVLSGGDDPVTSGSTVDGSSGGATTTGSSGSSGSTGSTGSTGQSSASSGGGTWPPVDVGAPMTGEAGKACNGKIDVVFVITEGSNKAQLDAGFPAFAAIMQEEFADLDLHVMIVDPDGEWGDSYYCPKNKCPADGGCSVEPDFPCWALHDEDALTKCDRTLGAGVVFPAGLGTMNKPCGLETGHRFITGDDPDFTERFICLAQPGHNTGNTYAQHGTSLGRSLSWDLRLGCNQGFLRDDALLFAVQIVSHNYEDHEPSTWASTVLEAKNNEQDLVVALAISRGWKNSEPKPLCDVVSDEPTGLTAWAFDFDHHVFGSLCAPSYVPFFAEAAAMAADLCNPAPK